MFNYIFRIIYYIKFILSLINRCFRIMYGVSVKIAFLLSRF